MQPISGVDIAGEIVEYVIRIAEGKMQIAE
jgi:hypothetical protein